MNRGFELHPRLAADTLIVGDFPLCRVLLMNERRYPWFILVPSIPDLVEICDLSNADQCRLILESSALSRQIQTKLSVDKVNIAAIGNLVSQLHLHVIGRFQEDAAWPHPVWGRFTPEPYTPAVLEGLITQLELQSMDGFSLKEGR
jgi:diadenosine tetraphosphate (Ap4A) HIT family hydrolase